VKRALIITYYWPPTGGSGVQRWVKFSKYLPSQGWQPVIYTPENPEMQTVDKSLLGDIPDEAEIIKTHITELYGIYRSLTGKKASSSEVNIVNNQKKSLAKRIMMWIRGNFFIPDPRVSWVRPSVRFLKKYLKAHPVNVIVSTGPPHSMHLIARKVSLETGIPWIADFRDPWTKIFYFKHLSLTGWAKKKHEKLESQVLNDATRVVAVSPLVQEDFQSRTSTPVELIPNGYDEEDFEQTVEPDGFFNITHTGLFASDGNPETLWKVLAKKASQDSDFAKSLRIRLVGKTDAQVIQSICDYGLKNNLVDLGYQNHQTAVREQKNATVLILPLRKEPEYKATIPGKTWEYLASGNPILGIGQKDGAMAMIVNKTHAGVVFDWDDEASIEKYIDFCWTRFKTDSFENPTEGIEQFSRRELTRKMAALMDSIMKI
jgi:glycosyltransferase involved in cell wall biosynthesis